MPLALTSRDQAHLARATRVLAGPLEFETPEAWMEAIATSAREAVGAAVGTVVLPREAGIQTASSAFSRTILEQYAEFFPLLDRYGDVRRSVRQGVVTRREFFGPHYDAVRETAYFQEFYPSIRSFDSICLFVPWERGRVTSHNVVQVLLNADDPRRPFDEKQVAMARLLFPALQAGVATYRQLALAHANLGALVDAAGGACAVYDSDGRLLHTTPALEAVLATEPRREALMEQACHLARALLQPEETLDLTSLAHRTFVGARGQYALSPSRANGLGPRSVVLVAVEAPPEPEPLPSAAMVSERLGLTPRQAEVALLLAERRASKEIAAALAISVHTARHHVEGVLRRLAVSRGEVSFLVRSLAVERGAAHVIGTGAQCR